MGSAVHRLAPSAVRDCCGHGHGGTRNVMWRIRGREYPADHFFEKFIVDSQQFGHGYVIGTWGEASDVRRRTGDGTAPLDYLEGEGRGRTLEPCSLYEDQLRRRLGEPVGECDDARDAGGVDGGTSPPDGGQPGGDGGAVDGGPARPDGGAARDARDGREGRGAGSSSAGCSTAVGRPGSPPASLGGIGAIVAVALVRRRARGRRRRVGLDDARQPRDSARFC